MTPIIVQIEVAGDRWNVDRRSRVRAAGSMDTAIVDLAKWQLPWCAAIVFRSVTASR
ncbi:hypothetical protein [uncultured Sphingomonas sp.]|uniref:hypothetical protein n=1 Tax=uncultured Sphingomonas sp. TaxID=158754 RepID=UPI0035CCA03C